MRAFQLKLHGLQTVISRVLKRVGCDFRGFQIEGVAVDQAIWYAHKLLDSAKKSNIRLLFCGDDVVEFEERIDAMRCNLI